MHERNITSLPIQNQGNSRFPLTACQQNRDSLYAISVFMAVIPLPF